MATSATTDTNWATTARRLGLTSVTEPAASEGEEEEQLAALTEAVTPLVAEARELLTSETTGSAPLTDAEKAKVSAFLDSIESIIAFVRKMMQGMANGERTVRRETALESLAKGLGAAQELMKQAIETKKAADEQMKSAVNGGIIKLITTIVAIVVAAALIATGVGAVAGVAIGGMIMMAGQAAAEIYQGVQTGKAANHTKKAAEFEQARAELNALIEQLKYREEEAGQDHSQLLQILDDASELMKDLRDLIGTGTGAN